MIRDRIRELRRVRAGDLEPHPDNWRKHPKAQREALAGVLAELGYADAVICRQLDDGRLQLLDGHLRADLDPDQEIPALLVDLDDDEARKLLATLDPLAAMAEANKEKLEQLLRESKANTEAMRETLRAVAGQHGIKIEDDNQEAPEPQIDRAEELREKWGVESGQLWLIEGQAGEHRLLCGDSTKRENWGKCHLVVTSPPYPAAEMWNKEGEHGLQDNIARLYQLGDAVYHECKEHSEVTCWNVGNCPKGNWSIEWLYIHWTQLAESLGDLVRSVVWRKGIVDPLPPPSGKRRPCIPHMIFEFILICYHGGWRPREKRTGLKNDEHNWQLDSVWTIGPQSAKAIGHKAPFPRELAGRCIRLWSIEGDTVCDPFLGSGTTMVAAEQLGRVCYGIEIEPKYVAVTLERLADMGLEPRLE